MLPDRTDVLVVGGGVIGLTIARELLRAGRGDVVVIEQEPDLGAHASGRNSGVLHAGIYYAPDSAKARTCLAGNRLMRAYCEEQGLPLLDRGQGDRRAERGRAPRARGAAPARERERRAGPVRGREGARRPRADGADDGEGAPLARHGGGGPEGRAAEPARRARGGGRAHRDRVPVPPARRARTSAETTLGRIRFRRVVNPAGAWCDEVARAFGVGAAYRLIPFKGIYRKLRAGASYPVNGNIYPVPDVRNPFLGSTSPAASTATSTWARPPSRRSAARTTGSCAGRAARRSAILAQDAALFFSNPKFRTVALAEPRKYLPAFFHRDAARLVKRYDPSLFVAAEKVGIRPQLVDWRTKELVMDFLVEAKDASVHVLNPVSPAFTSSMELARVVVAEHFR